MLSRRSKCEYGKYSNWFVIITVTWLVKFDEKKRVKNNFRKGSTLMRLVEVLTTWWAADGLVENVWECLRMYENGNDIIGVYFVNI